MKDDDESWEFIVLIHPSSLILHRFQGGVAKW